MPLDSRFPAVEAHTRTSPSWDLLVLGLLVVAGAGVRLWGIDFGLPHTQARPDETHVMDVALHYLRGNLWPAFYDYPRLYNYALVVLYLGYLAVGYTVGWFASLADLLASWPVHWEPFFLISRCLSAICGTLTIPVVYAVARDLVGRAAGLAAALFMAFAFLHVRDSHYGTTDAAMTLLIVLAVRHLLKSDLGGWNRHDATAAVVAGLAAATKYNAVLLLVPLGLSQILHLLAVPAPRLRRFFDARAAILAAGFSLAFLVGVPFVLFDHVRFAADMRLLGASMRGGVGAVPTESGWWYHLAVSLRHGLGLPLLIAGLAGLPLMVRRDWRRGLLFLAFPLAYYGVAGGISNLFVRYAIPLVPFLCVSAAAVVVTVSRLVTRGRAWAAVGVVLAMALVGPSARKVVAFDRLMARTDNRVVVSGWLAGNAPRGSSILQSGSLYGYAQIHPALGLEPWMWDRRARTFTYRRAPVEGKPDYILLQESPIPSTTQPVVLDLLRSGYDLVGTFRAYDPRIQDNIYEAQDAFYLPYGRFQKVFRPGPNFQVYRHSHALSANGK